MKLVLVASGTRGDVQPFLALGLGLQRAGGKVLIVCPKNEKTFVEQYGLACHPLSVDVQEIMNKEAVQKMTEGTNPFKFLLNHRATNDTMKRAMLHTQTEVWSAVQGADAIIYHPGMANAFYMARELGIPAIMASPFPIVPTDKYPAVLFYNGPRLGRWYNRLTHNLFERIFGQLSRGGAREFWQMQGKSNVLTSQPVSRLQVESGQLVLGSYSQFLFPRPADWPANVQITGPWSLPAEPDWTPPADLIRFLQAGPPPVYIGFGSIKNIASFGQTLNIIGGALARTDQRAILSLGWSSLPEGHTLPDGVFLLKSAPHSWLFEHVSAVVHHGGAGTTATGLLAGRPTLIIPHTADQPAWGRRVFELGVGPRPIARPKLTVYKLSAALQALRQPDVTDNAAALGKQMHDEPGMELAVLLILRYVNERYQSGNG